MERTKAIQASILLARLRDFIAPIRRLPTELLTDIFVTFVESKGSPWTITRVSASWRTLVGRTPRLWSYISLDGDPFRTGFDTGRHHQSCSTPGHLDRAIDRAVSAPLHIALTRSRKWDWNHFGSLLRKLGQRGFPNCKSLKLNYCDNVEEPIGDLPFLPPVFSFPKLTKIKISDQWNDFDFLDRLIRGISETSPQMRTFKATSSHCNFVLAEQPSLWNRLCDVKCKNIQPPDTEELALLDAPLAMIEMLKLHCIYVLEHPDGHPSPLPSLRHASFYAGNTGWMVGKTFAQLAFLELDNCFVEPADRCSISFPVLSHLLLREAESWPFIKAVHAPSLHILELTGESHQSMSSFADHWVEDGQQLAPKVFRAPLIMEWGDFGLALERMREIEDLDLSFTKRHRETAGRLLEKLIIPHETGSVYLPRLRRISFSGSVPDDIHILIGEVERQRPAITISMVAIA